MALWVDRWLVVRCFIGSLEVFFLVKSSRALWSIKPGFQSSRTIACGVSRGTPGEHEVFAPRARRRRKPENPVVKRASEASPPPKFIDAIFNLFNLGIVWGPGYPREQVTFSRSATHPTSHRLTEQP